MRADRGAGSHMTSAEIAAYVDGTLSQPERTELEGHLAECARCRDELVGVWRTVQGRAASGRPGIRAFPRRLAGGLVAVAAGVLLLVVTLPNATRSPTHRADIGTPGAPVAQGPRGTVVQPPVFVWSEVPGADLYRVVVFDRRGGVLWEQETGDTTMAMPSGVLPAEATYFWKVEARTDWDRWRSSGLIEFTLQPLNH